MTHLSFKKYRRVECAFLVIFTYEHQDMKSHAIF